ncbi:MAG: cysteine--tRNA ligase [Patescibacteria group bacterium]|nr:cysteine--tRNA ligase [Patescibacteria group bacterium]
MDIYIYNTLTRQKEKFVPVDPNLVRMYTCGPTVYRDVHIGNYRTYLMADFARRVLEYNGYRVKKIQNITDVGHMRRNETNPEAFDPVIMAALESGRKPLEITQSYTEQFLADNERLNIQPADVYPKASDHIEEIIEVVKELLNKGFAYDSGENIYFDVKKFKDYGELSGNTLTKMEKLLEAVRVASETDKTDSADFVLWKRVDPQYLMKWDSPWGLGTPGWHIECTAMSLKYLTSVFSDRLPDNRIHLTIDLHTGGEDNIFPHHEDEIAQSESFTGQKFVNIWLHGGHLTVEGEKMARRRGNVFLVQDLVDRGFDPLSFRYLTMTSYYRSKMNFTWDSLAASQKALDKIYQLVKSGPAPIQHSDPSYAKEQVLIGCAEYEQRFLEAVNDDLNMPKALAVVWDLVKSDYPLSAKKASLFKFDKVLGLRLKETSEKPEEVPSGVLQLVEERENSRNNKEFARADELRGKIEDLGFTVEDTPKGPKIVRM